MRDLLVIVMPSVSIIVVAGMTIWSWWSLRRVRDSAYHRGFTRGYGNGQRDGRAEERALRTVLPYRIDKPED